MAERCSPWRDSDPSQDLLGNARRQCVASVGLDEKPSCTRLPVVIPPRLAISPVDVSDGPKAKIRHQLPRGPRSLSPSITSDRQREKSVSRGIAQPRTATGSAYGSSAGFRVVGRPMHRSGTIRLFLALPRTSHPPIDRSAAVRFASESRSIARLRRSVHLSARSQTLPVRQFRV
jgi:hypothetical protein